jgi:hypothetical protein
MKPHLLHFPCRDAVFDWFGESSASGVLPVTVDLLAEQREFESLLANRTKRITCYCCGNPRARYVVCRRRGQTTDKLFPRRYPNSQHLHSPGCFSYAAELLPTGNEAGDDQPVAVRAGGDFSALRRELSDPEYSIVAMRRRDRAQAETGARLSSQASRRITVGLQRLAREVLQRSGVCEWRPAFEGRRNERVFNGRVKGAISDLLAQAAGPAGELLRSFSDISFVPWSYLSPEGLKTPPAMTKCVGFGFVESLGPENEHGARAMTLRNHSECPVVVPRRILDGEGRNPRSPLLSFLAHPVWVIFVAGLYDGQWKAHALVAFRLSERSLIPIESNHENAMVDHLVRRGRAFVRWLLPPPELKGRRFIPDFQLMDTAMREYIEVAGLMATPAYAEAIQRKVVLLVLRLLVWDARLPLSQFALPAPSVVATRFSVF